MIQYISSADTSKLELYADTMRAGANYKSMVLRSGVTIRVNPFSNDLGLIEDVSIGDTISYVHPASGEHFILIFREALIFEDIFKFSLINPNQMKGRGVTVSNISR